MARILLLNGPNLNLLGSREPEIYGHQSLADVLSGLTAVARELGHELQHCQSNAEHELIAAIQDAPGEGIAFILINPAAFAHTSVALRDALAAVALPFIEIHISNIHARERFRRRSYLAGLAVGTVSGLGTYGYELALRAADRQLKRV